MTKFDRNKTVYFDEHIHPELMEGFRFTGFRCLRIGSTTKYRGRQELDYIGKIASEGALFVTCDQGFADRVVDIGVKHAGIVLLPTGWDDDTLSFAVHGLAGYIKGAIEKDGRRSLHNQIYYINDQGYHLIVNGKDRLLVSTDGMQIYIDEYLAEHFSER